MDTVPTQTPELAQSVAALATVIAPHLAGAFQVVAEEKAVGIKGFSEELAHIVVTLGLERRSGWLDGKEGFLYETFSGPAPAPFEAITVCVDLVSTPVEAWL